MSSQESLTHREVTLDDPEAFNSILRFKPYIYDDLRNSPPVYVYGGNYRTFKAYNRLLDRYHHPPLHTSRILDIVALACITEYGQVAATAASITEHNGSLETTIYVAYNQEAPPGVAAHIENLFTKMRYLVLNFDLEKISLFVLMKRRCLPYVHWVMLCTNLAGTCGYTTCVNGNISSV